MALENPKKRKSTSSDLKRNLPVESKKKNSVSLDHKKRKQKVESLSTSTLKKSSSSEGRGSSVLARLVDSGIVSEHETVFYLRRKDKSVMKEGQITRDGVLCCCCNVVFLLSKFEAHAGSTLHRPSANMFLQNGRSLMDCQLASEGGEACSDATSRQSSSSLSRTRSASRSEDKNDNICQICGDGGKLMLCDSCPSAFHADCLHLDKVPDGDWHCSRCRCGTCGLGKDVESDKENTRMFSCVQCQVSYHQRCLREVPEAVNDPWFCNKTCKDVFDKLRKLVGCVFPLDRGLSWMLLRSSEGSELSAKSDSQIYLHKRLSEALKLLQQCFDPIMDFETGVNMLSQVVFSRKSLARRRDCSGFYTMLLLKEEKVLSAATIRVHGKLLAEMPFVGTDYEFRQQGVCKALMQALETMLRGLGVYKLVLPSINEVVDTWTGSFGFKVMSVQDCKLLSGTSLLSFPGTTLLLKSLLGPGQGPGQAQSVDPGLDNGAPVRRRSMRLQLIKGEALPSNEGLPSSQPISCH